MGDTPSLPNSKIEAEDRHANFYDARVNLDHTRRPGRPTVVKLTDARIVTRRARRHEATARPYPAAVPYEQQHSRTGSEAAIDQLPVPRSTAPAVRSMILRSAQNDQCSM